MMVAAVLVVGYLLYNYYPRTMAKTYVPDTTLPDSSRIPPCPAGTQRAPNGLDCTQKTL